MERKKADLINWAGDIPLAKMFAEWMKRCNLKTIKNLDYSMDFGTNEIKITYSLN